MTDKNEIDTALKGQEDIEKELEETLTEDSVGLNLPQSQVVTIYANQRYQYAVAYYQNKSQFEAAHASVIANEAVGNKSAAEKFQKQEDEAAVLMKFCLRSIRGIDKVCPEAKIKMEEVVAAVNETEAKKKVK